MFKNKKIKIFVTVFLIALMLTFTFPSVAFADQTSDVSSFTTRLYQTCLNRSPDPAGLNNWVNNLISGTVTGGQAAYGFVFSEELKNRNLNNDQFLVIMYKAFFDRPADTGGYNNWMGLLNGGSSREFVFSNFVNSKEFADICDKYGIQAGTIVVENTTAVTSAGNLYLLPFSGSYAVTQGNNGAYSHTNMMQYAWDFNLPEGTPVLASRGGQVSLAFGDWPSDHHGGIELAREVNYVVINHSDGTSALYLHLSKVSVKIGDKISQGQEIGLSGNTGWSTGPHLHFQVENTGSDWFNQSVPISFSN